MTTNLHLVFPGTCRDAFKFYEATFNSKVQMTMTYDEAPAGTPVPQGSTGLVMYTAMPLGNITLMGCDGPPDRRETLGGFQISIGSSDEAEVKQIFATLSEGGSVQMPLGPTFWSPLFGMTKDRFGAGWMVGVPGPQPS